MQFNVTLLHLDLSLNDFSFKAFDAIERKVAENRRSFRQSAVTRFEQHLSSLTEDQAELARVKTELEEARSKRAEAEAVMEETIRSLEQTEDKCKDEQRSWQEKIMSSTKELNKTELLKLELEKSIVATKAEREKSYKALVTKLHHEKETKAKLELRVIVERRNTEEALAAISKDFDQLDASRKAAITDRDAARRGVDALREKVSRLAASLNPVGIAVQAQDLGPTSTPKGKQLPRTTGIPDSSRKKPPASRAGADTFRK